MSLGAALRRVWDVPGDAVRASGVEERLYGVSTQAELVASWLDEPYDLSPCQEPGVVADAVATTLSWLRSTDSLPTRHLTALGIADLNPANVLWDGVTCRLVDFEDGGLTDPAFELADHVEHLGGRRDAIYDVDALVAAVGLSAEELERTAAYRPLWAAFWLAMLLPGNGGWERNPPGTTEAQAAHVVGLLG